MNLKNLLTWQNVIVAVIFYYVLHYFTGFSLFGSNVEGMATSPGTLIQLASSSGYYPFWQSGYDYRYPYYRYIYPYYSYNYTSYPYYEWRMFPKPYGYYNYY